VWAKKQAFRSWIMYIPTSHGPIQW